VGAERWFYRTAEEWNALAERLKQTPCPHCKVVGTLIRHGYLRGYDDSSPQRKIVRARRLFSSNRNARRGWSDHQRLAHRQDPTAQPERASASPWPSANPPFFLSDRGLRYARRSRVARAAQEAPMSTTIDPELLNHYTVAIYPFLHCLGTGDRASRLENLGRRWSPWWTRLTEPERAAGLESTAFFLPYVRSLLYPEVSLLAGEAPGLQFSHWAQHISEWSKGGLAAFVGHLPRSAILRLTLREETLQPLGRFTLAPRRAAEDPVRAALPGRLAWVDALLFPSGVGFLLLKYRLGASAPRLSQLIELNRSVRLIQPPSAGWSLAQLRFDHCQATVRDLINHLTQGLVGDGKDPFQPLGTTMQETAYTDTEAGMAYGERCQLLSYASVHLDEADRAALPAGVFSCGEDRLLFEYAASIGLGQSVDHPMWVPSPEQAERVRRENRWAWWRCWKAMALKESCVFLGTEDIPFNRRSLPRVLEQSYLPLYLYVLYQKTQLTMFANDLMHEVAQVGDHLSGARELLRRFVAFRNRFWFNEVTRKPQGGDLYRLMQQSLDVPNLYEMALASVKEAKEYYEDRWDRQVRFALTLLGLGGPVAAAFGAAQTFLDGLPLVAVCLVLAASALGGLWVMRGGHRKPAVRTRKRPVQVEGPRLLPFPDAEEQSFARAG